MRMRQERRKHMQEEGVAEKGPGMRKLTQKQRLEGRMQLHHSQEGPHCQHISHRLCQGHKDLYYKTNEHFKARKECLLKRFTNSRKLSVKVCKTWFESQRTHYSKLTQSQSTSKELTECQNWIQDKFGR